jgi:hypothetical protein
MRNWQNAKFFPSIPIGELPSVIISSEDQPEPDLPIGYRGQDFTWWVTPGWEGVLPGNWPIWLVSRNAPLETRNIILWARLDLFPGGMFNQVDQTSSDIQEELPFNSLPVE